MQMGLWIVMRHYVEMGTASSQNRNKKSDVMLMVVMLAVLRQPCSGWNIHVRPFYFYLSLFCLSRNLYKAFCTEKHSSASLMRYFLVQVSTHTWPLSVCLSMIQTANMQGCIYFSFEKKENESINVQSCMGIKGSLHVMCKADDLNGCSSLQTNFKKKDDTLTFMATLWRHNMSLGLR